MELANQPECYVWNGYLATNQTVTWTAECAGGLAQGTGTLTRVWDSGKRTLESTGRTRERPRPVPVLARKGGGCRSRVTGKGVPVQAAGWRKGRVL